MNPRDIDRPWFLRRYSLSPGFSVRSRVLYTQEEEARPWSGGTGMNFSFPRRSACLEIYIRRMPYRIIAGPAGDASLALMTERSRIFTFNIIESRPLVEASGRTSTVCWPFSIRAIGNRAIFAVIAVRRPRTRLFKQPLRKHARVLAYAYAVQLQRSIELAKKDLVNYRGIFVRL